LESVLAGGDSDVGDKLRQDGYGARPSAGKRLEVTLAERTGFDGDGSKFPFRNNSARLLYVYV
jgi:hypothetical protein